MELFLHLPDPLVYDFNDPDDQYVMFDRALSGMLLLRFSVPMNTARGTVTMDGAPVPHIVKAVRVGSDTVWFLGLRLAEFLYGYGLSRTLLFSGFYAADGTPFADLMLQVSTPEKPVPTPVFAEHEAVALEAAREGIVLLQNEHDALPYRGKVLNLFGDLFLFRTGAIGAGKIHPRHTMGLLEAAENEPSFTLNPELISFYRRGESSVPDAALLARARAQSDTAFFVLSRLSGENADNHSGRGEYRLTEAEEALLKALSDSFLHVIVILNVGYPVELTAFFNHHVDALLYTGFGGMLAGQAIMDVIAGRISPSGKLPFSWYKTYIDVPTANDFYDAANGRRVLSGDPIWLNTVYREGIFVGYRAGIEKPVFPFGHGQSYTTFSHRIETFSFDGKTLTVSVAVTNTGSVCGKEVAALYVSKPSERLPQPPRELIAFAKTDALRPNESQTLVLTVPKARLCSFDESASAYALEVGEYRFFLGGSAKDAIPSGSMILSHEVLRAAPRRVLPNVEITKTASGILTGAAYFSAPKAGSEAFPHETLPSSKKTLTYQDIKSDPTLLEPFIGSLDPKMLARICVCASHGWDMDGRGEAGRLFRPDGLDLPEFVVADGNSGVNLNEPNIGFPSGVTLCASWNTTLMQSVGRVIGEEAKRLGIHMILAPGMNLLRNPLCGRNPEYFSEDPLLAGRMAGFYCKGLESTGVGGCYKHFLCNNAESGRKRNQSIVPVRALRELYLAAFAYAMEVHEPAAVMTAYNALNGRFTSCDPELIEGLLFEELGFSGFVMTDWTSYDTADVVEMARAGNCWITPGSTDDAFTRPLVDAVASGRLLLGQLQQNALRIVRTLLRLGL